VDPLRAGAVMLLEDGFRYLCDVDCRGRFLDGERAHDAFYRQRASRPPPEPRRDPTTGRIRTGDPVDLEPLRHEPGPLPEARVPFPWIGAGASLGAIAVGAVAASATLALAAAALTWVAAGAALQASWRARRDVGSLAWAVGPAGAALAAFAALLGRIEDDRAWAGLVGAGIAGGAVVARAWLDASMQKPVADVVRALPHLLPRTVRVPVKDDTNPVEVTFIEVETARVRTGEEVLAIGGETVAVDGVVKAGEAWAFLYPGSTTAVRREPGDPLLAGARVKEGAARILATRVGDDRALVRPARFGAATGADAAPLPRIAARVTSWGGVAALGGAFVALAMADGSGAGAQLSAAAAVLVAAPLLAARRAAELPLVAAAAMSAARGVAYHSARALDAAGRASVAALCTRGIVTEGELEVVEVHCLGAARRDRGLRREGSEQGLMREASEQGLRREVSETGPRREASEQGLRGFRRSSSAPPSPEEGPIVALAAAAEAAAETHPIGRAILRHAEARGIAPESVRRATFLPGRGVTALAPGGEALVIGNRRLLLAEGVSVAVADAEAARAEARGYTTLFVGLGGRVRAVISMQDSPRPGARAAVQRIFDQHIEVVLLSGDHRTTVETLAQKLDVANIRAELLPEERGTEVQRLRETGGTIAVVGRAKHDEAALAAADVPIALGAAGSSAGERTVALATDDVRDAAAALWIARAARTGAWRAFTACIVGGGVLVAAAALGLAPPAFAAPLALVVDSFALAAGHRLLRRVELRVPARS